MAKHTIHLTEGAPRGMNAKMNLLTRTLVVKIHAVDMMAEQTIQVTEGAPRGTNANLNMLAAFVIENTLAVKQHATDYQDGPACTLQDAPKNISANRLK
jgi:hypothetical protein